MKNKKLRNLLEFKDREQVRQLLSLSSGQKSEGEIAEVLLNFIKNTKWVLHGFFEGPTLFALIGLQLLAKKEGKILYIAVRPENQKTGLGRDLIEMCQTKYKLKKISAESNSETLSFYEKLGFKLSENSTEAGVLSKSYSEKTK